MFVYRDGISKRGLALLEAAEYEQGIVGHLVVDQPGFVVRYGTFDHLRLELVQIGLIDACGLHQFTRIRVRLKQVHKGLQGLFEAAFGDGLFYGFGSHDDGKTQ
jgi:hypothetical protein